MEDDDVNFVEKKRPAKKRSSRADVVGGFYTEPEQSPWKLSKREWEAIEDESSLDIPHEVRNVVHGVVLDYFSDRERELQAFFASEALAYVGQVKGVADRLVSLLADKHASPAIAAARDVLSEGMFNPHDPAFDPLSQRAENGEHDFDAADEAIWQSNPLSDALREMVGALQVLARAADQIAEAAKLLENPDSIRPEKPTAMAWTIMTRELIHGFCAGGLPTGVKKDCSKGSSQFTLFMLALTRHWPEKYRQFNTGRDWQESPQAMATAINEARKSGGEIK